MLGTTCAAICSGLNYELIYKFGVPSLSKHLQITAASFVPREEVTPGKLGETRLREILSIDTIQCSE